MGLSFFRDFETNVILDADWTEQGESVIVTAVMACRDFFERNQIWLVSHPLFAVAEQALQLNLGCSDASLSSHQQISFRLLQCPIVYLCSMRVILANNCHLQSSQSPLVHRFIYFLFLRSLPPADPRLRLSGAQILLLKQEATQPSRTLLSWSANRNYTH